jgi:hypothetical protein
MVKRYKLSGLSLAKVVKVADCCKKIITSYYTNGTFSTYLHAYNKKVPPQFDYLPPAYPFTLLP